MQRLIVVLLGWLVIVPLPAMAQNRTSANYDVEVLVFEMQLPEYEGSELWTRAPRSPDPTAMVIEGTPPSAEFASAMAAMQSDGRYRVLLHKRWSQTAEPKSGQPPVLLSADSALSGTFRFYLSRFLHAELNLAYQPLTGAIGAGTSENEGLPSFVINEQRRVKSNDMNYFDHPKFGVLVRVSPNAG